ncbi:MAG: hypothetical protein ACP5NK_07280 [Thermoplasmata archaeon]
MYTGMDIPVKEIVCTTIDEQGNALRKCRVENSFENRDALVKNYPEGTAL